MDELADARDRRVARHALLQPVFHGLDVMIGAAFDDLDGFSIRHGKTCHDTVEIGDRGI